MSADTLKIPFAAYFLIAFFSRPHKLLVNLSPFVLTQFGDSQQFYSVAKRLTVINAESGENGSDGKQRKSSGAMGGGSGRISGRRDARGDGSAAGAKRRRKECQAAQGEQAAEKMVAIHHRSDFLLLKGLCGVRGGRRHLDELEGGERSELGIGLGVKVKRKRR